MSRKLPEKTKKILNSKKLLFNLYKDLTSKEIAKKLDISDECVKKYLSINKIKLNSKLRSKKQQKRLDKKLGTRKYLSKRGYLFVKFPGGKREKRRT